jgi:tRNA(Ile)-lysidine synthase
MTTGSRLVGSPRLIESDEFAALMAGCGPFEDRPHIAVALSGGPDSLALTLLLADWTAAFGGRLTALTVDHGLRPDSADEARTVAGWMAAKGITHHILTWDGAKPVTGLMAAAREARYEHLNGWCRAEGVLHLAIAHQLEDQAATFLMRLRRGSGLDGLAAMPPVVEGMPRLLRPLLTVSRERLLARLRAAGQAWIEDPSNHNPAFERTAATDFVSHGNSLGLTAERVALAADSLLRARRALEEAIADCLADCASLDALGVAHVEIGALMAASEEVRLRALARLLRTVGGEAYTPRLERLTRLLTAVEDGHLGRGRTLAGCRILPQGNGALRLLREAAAIAPDGPVPSGDFLWDRRFRITLSDVPMPGLQVGALTADRWRGIKSEVGDCTISAQVRATLPALFDQEGVAAVPHLGYRRAGWSGAVQARFTPALALT